MSHSHDKPKPRKRRSDAHVVNAAEKAKVPQRTARRKIKRCEQLVDLAVLLAAAKGADERTANSFAKLFLDLAANVSDADLATIAKMPDDFRLGIAARLWKADKPTGEELFAELDRPKPSRSEQLIAELARFHSESTPDEWDIFQGKALARGFVVGADVTDERTDEFRQCADENPGRCTGYVEALDVLRRCRVLLVDGPERRFEAFVSPHGEHNSIFKPVVEDSPKPDETEPEPEPETDIAANWPGSDEPSDEQIAEWIEDGNSTTPASHDELVEAGV
jgi:hypothetical protein